jgi:DNA-binding NarL/FixJ family response regulator
MNSGMGAGTRRMGHGRLPWFLGADEVQVKLLVIDDHALVREGVKHILESVAPDTQVLEAGDAAEALLLTEHESIDLVLLDLGLPGLDGFQTLQLLHERSPSLPVIILSGGAEQSDVVNALEMGAAGFIPKSFTRELMLQAVRLVLAGGVYIPPQALGVGSAAEKPSQVAATPATVRQLGLTDRQTEVLALIAQGKPNKAIAAELDISEATVKAHMTEVLRALKVTNRAEAALAARRLGFH